MFVVMVCNLWMCGSLPYATYEQIEPCKALAMELTKRLREVYGLKGVCR